MRLNDVLSKATTVNIENYGQESVHAYSILYTMYIIYINNIDKLFISE